MIGIFRLILLVAIIVVAWTLFRELLFLLGVLQRKSTKDNGRDGYPFSTTGKQQQKPFEYGDVKDARFREISNDANDAPKE